MARDLHIQITVENGQAKAKLRETEQSLRDITLEEQKREAAMKQSHAALQALTGEAALRQMRQLGLDITASVKDLTAAFAEEESAIVALRTALQAQGQATPAVIAQYEALANQFQRTTTFSDDLIFQMEALLVQVGNVLPSQMDAALTAATNLAAGLGIDLRTATMLVGKAFEGETGTLQRYGIVIDETDLKARGIAAVLEAVNQKFGGQAQAQIETYGGRVEQMGNQMDDAKEKIGGLLAAGLLPLFEAFSALPSSVQSVILVVAALGIAIAPILVSLGVLIPLISTAWPAAIALLTPAVVGMASVFSGVLATALAATATFFSVTLPAAFQTILPFLGPIGWIAGGVIAALVVWKNWDTIGPIVKRVYLAVKEWLVDKFAAVVQWIGEKVGQVTGFFKNMYDSVVGSSYVPDMVRRIAAEFQSLDQAMVQPSILATTSVTGVFAAMARSVTAHLSAWTGGLQASLTGFLGGPDSLLGGILKGGLGAMLGPAGPLSGLIAAGIQKLGAIAIEGAKKIWAGIKRLFGGGEEGVDVNPNRDKFFEQYGGYEGLAEKLTAASDGNVAEQLIRMLYAADTRERFEAAQRPIVDLIGGNMFRAGTRGQFIDFGQSGQFAMLHGKERVVTESEGRLETRNLDHVLQRMEQLQRDLPHALERAVKNGFRLAPRPA